MVISVSPLTLVVPPFLAIFFVFSTLRVAVFPTPAALTVTAIVVVTIVATPSVLVSAIFFFTAVFRVAARVSRHSPHSTSTTLWLVRNSTMNQMNIPQHRSTSKFYMIQAG